MVCPSNSGFNKHPFLEKLSTFLVGSFLMPNLSINSVSYKEKIKSF
jgi:hypothetical protein